MYKLFLCLRYLRSKIIAWFAVGAIAVCVFLLIVVNSVMNGFLDKIEHAAKGLFGDIVVQSSDSLYGVGNYDELIGQIEAVKGVQAASPFILTDGYINVIGNEKFVRVAGIPLPGREKVGDFSKGLFAQPYSTDTAWQKPSWWNKKWGTPTKPSFDPSIEQMIAAIKYNSSIVRDELRRIDDEGHDDKLATKLDAALLDQQAVIMHLKMILPHQAKMRTLWDNLQTQRAKTPGKLTQEIENLQGEIDILADQYDFTNPDERIIMGEGIYFATFRTSSGAVIRRCAIPGRIATLYVRPLGEFSAESIQWSSSKMTIVDHCNTGVYNIDDSFVYVPFEKLQQMTGLDANDENQIPARCSQIHIKVDPKLSGVKQLGDIARQIQDICDNFRIQKPDTVNGSLEADTYRQLQAQLIDSIASQRTLTVTIFGIMSIVSVFLIFVIFYMIVLQKTRDIGILKSIGGSGPGIAVIFLGYGAAVGLVGSLAGITGGYFFVTHINAINRWIGRVAGVTFWSMETFMFAKIPDQVDWHATVYIVIGAVAAGLIGALIPAIIAATRQPIKALRYE